MGSEGVAEAGKTSGTHVMENVKRGQNILSIEKH